MAVVNAEDIARPFLLEIRGEVEALSARIRLLGLLASDARPSQVYSGYAAKGCATVGIEYEPRQVAAEELSQAIYAAGDDPSVHGVIVYYPVFGGARDRTLQNEVDPRKDVEGLNATWTRRLYGDVRTVDSEGKKKAVLPCTPLGVVKALGALGVTRRGDDPRRAAAGLKVAIFNRSEVVGRPLAAMLAHDGADVLSFDIDGVLRYEGTSARAADVDRATALAAADVIVTGVPDPSFPPIRAAEIKAGATAINVSHLKNLADDVPERARHVLLRVGPITVAMLLRNTLRLYRNFHAAGAGEPGLTC